MSFAFGQTKEGVEVEYGTERPSLLAEAGHGRLYILDIAPLPEV